MAHHPHLFFVCGCNGAGKSTLTSTIRTEMSDVMIIDPDRIAKDNRLTTVQTGKTVLLLLKDLILQKETFIKESTLSSVYDFRLLETAKASGYKTHLIFICLEHPDLAVSRVQARVSVGGHSVPFEDIQRRYKKGLENLPKAIKAFDIAVIMDNSSSKYENVAIFQHGELIHYYRTPGWFLACHNALDLPSPPVLGQGESHNESPSPSL